MMGCTATPTVVSVATPVVTVMPSLSGCDPILRKYVDPSMAEQGDLVTFTITIENRGQQATVNGQVWDLVPAHLEVLEVEVLGAEHEGQKVHPISDQTVRVDTGILGQDAELTILVHTKVRPFEAAPDPICIDNVAHFGADNCPDARAQAAPCLLPMTGTPETNPLWWMLAAGLATSVLVLGLAFSKKWQPKTPHRP